MPKKTLLIAFLIVILAAGTAATGFHIGRRTCEFTKETQEIKSPQDMKTRDTQRKSDLKLIKQALELYYRDHGRYPYILADSTTSLLRKNLQEELQEYIEQLPVDPFNNKDHYYRFDGSLNSGQRYVLSTALENPDDPEGPGYIIYGGNHTPLDFQEE